MSKELLLENKTIVITGAANGIGQATARRAAQEGARVVIGDFSDKAQDTVDEINEAGGQAIFVKTDVSVEEDVKNLIQTAVDEFGQIDGAFNNAGILNQPAKFADTGSFCGYGGCIPLLEIRNPSYA